MTEKTINRLTAAIGVALLPPLWAVFSEYIGITTGSVALICAGLFVANGNKQEDALKIIIGFLMGDLWGLLAVSIMTILPFSLYVELFCVLFILGFIAVFIATTKLEQLIYLPSWLTGWAIAMLIMGNVPIDKIGNLTVQIAISMIVGVLYVGVGVLKFQIFLESIIKVRRD